MCHKYSCPFIAGTLCILEYNLLIKYNMEFIYSQRYCVHAFCYYFFAKKSYQSANFILYVCLLYFLYPSSLDCMKNKWAYTYRTLFAFTSVSSDYKLFSKLWFPFSSGVLSLNFCFPCIFNVQQTCTQNCKINNMAISDC